LDNFKLSASRLLEKQSGSILRFYERLIKKATIAFLRAPKTVASSDRYHFDHYRLGLVNRKIQSQNLAVFML
jgi:hypothetical protein